MLCYRKQSQPPTCENLMMKTNDKAALLICLGLFALPLLTNGAEEPEYVDVPPPPARLDSDDDAEQPQRDEREREQLGSEQAEHPEECD